MGCKGTKERDGGDDLVNKQNTANGAEEFNMLAEENPVAAKLREEWSKVVQSISTMPAETRGEVWADTANNRLTHRCVDRVGKLFLVYIRNDLMSRGWGGSFDYTVVGVTQQGFLKVSVTLDASTAIKRSGDIVWETKVHYYSTA
ncbi:hypothetical protein DQ04_01001170 [Trypanosoma grayi]|uniref:hypothetical protein n=1 Tax=Trypanosoma grayi TaxID=71804 RepID=UPI0004F3F1AC|nr:hypothetical protein DQ04_01001170 [Trypanosoma grayi]KEG13454.1 hypothetical protein DQ04_01001170 [Trypanosoma grayi]